MNDPVRVLLIDDNATVRRCVRETLSVLGAETAELSGLPSGGLDSAAWFGSGRPDLAIVDCSQTSDQQWARLRACLDESAGAVPVLPISIHPLAIPDIISRRPDVATPLAKPFTPRQLCFAAFMVQPRLRPLGGEPPFPRRAQEPDPEPSWDENAQADFELHRAGAVQTTPHANARPHTNKGRNFSDEGWDLPESDSGSLGGSIFDDPPSAHGEVDQAPAPEEGELLAAFEDFEDLQPIEQPISAAAEAPSADLEILDVVEAEPIPEWIEMLVGVWPVISREGWGDVRARLVTASLTVAGVVDEDYWMAPEVAEGAADHIEFLGQARGIQGDLGWLDALGTMKMVRTRRARGILEYEDAYTAMRLSVHGDRLHGLEPRVRRQDLLLGQLLIAAGNLSEEELLEALRRQSEDDSRTLGHLLSDAGLLDEGKLNEALRAQAKGYLAEVVSMDGGQFSFRKSPGGDGRGANEGGHSLTRLSLEILKANPQSIRLADDALAVPDIAALYSLSDDALTASERDALAALEGGVTVADALNKLSALKEVEGDPTALLNRFQRVGLLNVITTS